MESPPGGGTGSGVVDKMIVTVVGPDRRAEVALPFAAPIAELLPGLAEICTRREPGTEPPVIDDQFWAIGRPGGDTFPATASLADCGVLEGEVLELRGFAQQAAGTIEPSTSPADAAPQGGGHDPRAAQRSRSDGEAAPAADEAVLPEAPPGEALPLPAITAGPIPSSVLAGPPPAAPGTLQPPAPPLTRTAHTLPRRSPFNRRVGVATGALVTPPSVTEQLVPVTTEEAYRPPTPRELSRRQAPTPLQRARRAWRSTDYRRQLDIAIAAPRLSRCATIAVLSPKGGVGKTTVAALLGELFALSRRDRILAVDTNPDFGSLGRTLTPEHNVFVDDLLEYLEHPALTVTALDTSLGRAAHGLMVLPSPTDPERMTRLDQQAYEKVIVRLQAMVGVIMLDCGTGLQDPATRAAINTADQLIVVTDAEPPTASLVAEACRLLQNANKPITLVVNKMRDHGNRLDVNVFAAHVPHARALVVIPAEPAGAVRLANGEFTWSDAPAGWQRSLRELAAVIVAGWAELDIAS
jgi:MinD-like ATPase involved in chromosome partitioning or flagellar assembly